MPPHPPHPARTTSTTTTTTRTTKTVESPSAEIPTSLPTKSEAPLPRWNLLFPNEPVSIKIVFQQYLAPRQTKWRDRLGWVSVTNTAGQVVYDPFVTYPKEPGLMKHFSNKRYNVAKEDLLLRHGARDGKEVEENLVQILNGRAVVVHSRKGYSDACYYFEDVLGDLLVWDTQLLYADLQHDAQPTLSTVTRLVLGRSVHRECDHTRRPDQDAIAAMELYLLRFPYDREAQRRLYDRIGWTPGPPQQQTKPNWKKRIEIQKAKSTFDLQSGLRSPVALHRRPGSSECLREPAPSATAPVEAVPAAHQFALRLHRRHFADTRPKGDRGPHQVF